MASIGPQLPRDLAKRKRTPTDESDSDGESPPAKRRSVGPSLPPRSAAPAPVPANQDEIALDDDDASSSNGGYGPRMPSSAKQETPTAKPKPPSSPPPSRRVLGPTMPPSAPPANEDEIALESDSDSDSGRGPAPAPQTQRRVIGPTMPPAPLNERPSRSPSPSHHPRTQGDPDQENRASSSDSDSDDSDDFTPALPSAPLTAAQLAAQARRRELEAAEAAARHDSPAQQGRDDWMLAPPPVGSSRTPDLSNLGKPRRFATGRPGRPGPHSNGPAELSSLWTESPEERRRRLADEVLGRGGGSGSSGSKMPGTLPAAPDGRDSRHTSASNDERQARQIREFTEQTRGRSLYETHREAQLEGRKKKEKGTERGDGEGIGTKAKNMYDQDEEDDPSKRAFDKEKDMALGRKIGTAQRRELINRAADFGGRFIKGSYL